MTQSNLDYFLKSYFPERLEKFPKSRFLFAYSGHGFLDGDRGYVLTNGATSFTDKRNAVDLATIRTDLNSDIEAGYQVLALINSCNGGAFLTRTSFGNAYIPKHPGAHAITAGASSERAWSDKAVGSGSVFFEKLLSGLGGAADRIPDGGDGIITVSELYAYLRQEVELSTGQDQNPQLGDLSANQSEGEFFFLNRNRQIAANLVPAWNPVERTSMGTDERQSSSSDSQIPPGDALRTFGADWKSTANGSGMYYNGTFGDSSYIQQAFDGVLHVELSLSQSNARYERMQFRSSPINKSYGADLSPGFGRPNVHVDLNLVYTISVFLTKPTALLPIQPVAGGAFKVSPFSSSMCQWQCFEIEITGTWIAKAGGHEYYGDIQPITEGGAGASVVATLWVDPHHFPTEIAVTSIDWSGNSNNVTNMTLIDTTIEDVPVKVFLTSVSFPNLKGPQSLMNSDK